MAEPTVVGYVDKSIFVEVDGVEIVVGMATVPVTFRQPDTAGHVETDAGPVQITFDFTGHGGCPADLYLPNYVKVGDDRHVIGETGCCAKCQPTSPFDA